MEHLDTRLTPPLQDAPETGWEDSYANVDPEWEEEGEGEKCPGPFEIITNPVMEELEGTILYLMMETASLARSLYVEGYAFPVKGCPVDISFCFEAVPWLMEQDWDGYRLNEHMVEEWGFLDELSRLLPR